MENIVCNELRIRGFHVDAGVAARNKTDEKGQGQRKQLEIDFVCSRGSRRYYIQSAWAIPVQRKMEQEQRPLMLAGDFFKKIIITGDAPAPCYNENGILAMNICDFLLDQDSLEY